jgi:hypothetical protein
MVVRRAGLASLFPPKGGGKKLPFPPGTPIPRDPWGGSCPHPEEEILLADDSWIKAKDIKTGDKVKTLTAKDFKEGEYEITRAEIIDNQPRCEVFFKDSKSIISSYSHPYAVEDKGFVEAQDIKVGDTVGDLIVTATKPLDWGPVVSLSVDEAETYMLKAGSEDKPVAVLSHNKTPRPPTLPPTEPVMPPIGLYPEPVEPIGPRPPRPPGVSLRALKMKRQRLREQLRQIEAQIRSLGRERPIRDPWDFGGEPPMPTPWDPQPIGPPTMPGPGTPPPSMPAPTIPVGPPTMPPRPIPPWGG